jgi:hypothetical protein
VPNNNRRSTLGLFADIAALGHVLVLVLIVFVGGSTISGIVVLVKHGSVPAWTLFLNVGASLLMVPAYQRGRRNPDDIAVARRIRSLEETVEKAKLEATMAKSYITHVRGFIAEIRIVWASDSPEAGIASAERLRYGIFAAVTDGLKGQRDEHIWCAYFTPVDDGTRELLRAEAGYYWGHGHEIEQNPLDRRNSLAGAAYTTGRIVHSANGKEDPRFWRTGISELDNIGSIVCVPSFGYGADAAADPIAVLSVSSSLIDKFDETDHRFAAICTEAIAFTDHLIEVFRSREQQSRNRKRPQDADETSQDRPEGQ